MGAHLAVPLKGKKEVDKSELLRFSSPYWRPDLDILYFSIGIFVRYILCHSIGTSSFQSLFQTALHIYIYALKLNTEIGRVFWILGLIFCKINKGYK